MNSKLPEYGIKFIESPGNDNIINWLLAKLAYILQMLQQQLFNMRRVI